MAPCVKGDSAPSRAPCGGGKVCVRRTLLPQRASIGRPSRISRVARRIGSRSARFAGALSRSACGSRCAQLARPGARSPARRGPRRARGRVDATSGPVGIGDVARSELQPLWGARSHRPRRLAPDRWHAADHRVQDRPRRCSGNPRHTSTQRCGWLASWLASSDCRALSGRPGPDLSREHDHPPSPGNAGATVPSVRTARPAGDHLASAPGGATPIRAADLLKRESEQPSGKKRPPRSGSARLVSTISAVQTRREAAASC